jgi:hypothetical protein
MLRHPYRWLLPSAIRLPVAVAVLAGPSTGLACARQADVATARQYTMLPDGIHSEFPGHATFTESRTACKVQASPISSISATRPLRTQPAAGDQPSSFLCTGWGVEACDGTGGWPESGNLKSLFLLPKYSPKDTEQPIDRQVAALTAFSSKSPEIPTRNSAKADRCDRTCKRTA